MSWDNNFKEYAVKAKDGKPLGPYNFYIFLLYKKITDKFLGGLALSDDRKFKILKTDLWDFVVEKDRDILSYIKNSYRNIEISGIDVSEEIVNEAKKITQGDSHWVSRGDITHLDFPESYFDVVLDYSTIDHVPEDKIELVFEEYSRVLKPGGRALVIFWQQTGWLRLLSRVYKLVSGRPIIDNQQNGDKFQYYLRQKVVSRKAYESGLIVKKNKLYIALLLNFFRGPLKIFYKLIPKKCFRSFVSLEVGRAFNFLFKYFCALCVIEVVKPYGLGKVIEFWDEKIKNDDALSGVLWKDNKVWNKFIDFEQKSLLKKYFNEIREQSLVLDFGCGTGRFLKIFKQKSKNVFGMDTSLGAISFCKKEGYIDSSHLYGGELNKETFGERKFDFIFSITSLQSITDKNGLRKALSILREKLSKNGKIVLLESITDQRGDPLVLNIKDGDFKEIVGELGLQILKVRRVDNPFFRKLYFRFNSSKYLKIFSYLVLPIIFLTEMTPLGVLLRREAWYRIMVIKLVTI